MVIAYYISLSMGWSHTHWAGLAVALCLLDTVGDSVNKGLLRILGTVAAGSMALLLAALFPQDRWSYLLCATLYISLCTYMAGHTSRWYFWFIGGYVMALLALAGGPTGASLFETVVLRVQQTCMGVTVYTLVSVLLWPRWKAPALTQTFGNLVEIERGIIGHCFARLGGEPEDSEATKLCGQATGILGRLPAVVDGAELDSFEVWQTRRLWRRCATGFATLNEVLERWRSGFADLAKLEVARFLPNLQALGAEFEARLAAVGRMLSGEPPGHRCVRIPVELDKEAEASRSQFDRAALIQARNQLRRIDELTRELFGICADIRGFGSSVQPGRSVPRPTPAYPIDLDRLEISVRAFSTVWIILLACIYIPGFPMPPGVIPVAAAVSIMFALTPEVPVQKFIAPILGSVAFAGVFHIFSRCRTSMTLQASAPESSSPSSFICFVLWKPAGRRSRSRYIHVRHGYPGQQPAVLRFLYVVNFGLMTQLAIAAFWIASFFSITYQPQDVILRQMRRFLHQLRPACLSWTRRCRTPSPAYAACLPSPGGQKPSRKDRTLDGGTAKRGSGSGTPRRHKRWPTACRDWATGCARSSSRVRRHFRDDPAGSDYRSIPYLLAWRFRRCCRSLRPCVRWARRQRPCGPGWMPSSRLSRPGSIVR